jgi:Tfp pilus assembly protein PilP
MRDLLKPAPAVVLALAASASGAGCGDSEEDAPPPAPPSTPVQPAPNRAIVPPTAGGGPGAPGAKGPLTAYLHVEDLMDASERSTIRHQFRESDFAQDPSGDNRDPFRSSYMLDIGLPSSGNNVPTDATEQCTAKQMVATSYSVRDLRLVGIVSRGLKRYALMQDSSNFGQIVTRGDCLGKEKARVKEIGAGYMTLEVMPEVGIAGASQVVQERSIPLYPEELPMTSRTLDDGDTGGTTITPVLPPSSSPPPVVMPPSQGGSGAVAPTGKAPGSAPAQPPVVMPPPSDKPDKKK